ncbi:hypothetical protein Pmani_015255 [Petrolisthes manimaculis]|uniref:Uncharacterized protein n=1 Tax=Petrolisthes manimaculis TaxID=1843537 RepID=A0AAE1PRZ1_9EUCA|nr:hypothetical protein Pmani_015255 [Petrolisthes manimaculis]
MFVLFTLAGWMAGSSSSHWLLAGWLLFLSLAPGWVAGWLLFLSLAPGLVAGWLLFLSLAPVVVGGGEDNQPQHDSSIVHSRMILDYESYSKDHTGENTVAIQ